MSDHIKHYLVAEMIHGALVPLHRAKGIAVVEWSKLSQVDKDEEAGAVTRMLQYGFNEAETESGRVHFAIIREMYPEMFSNKPAQVANVIAVTASDSVTPVEGTPIK